MKLTKEEAYGLLTAGLENPETIGYVPHCRYVGDLAGMIAGELGLDAEYATVLGYLHDIGRKVDPGNHIYAGYKFLKENGYKKGKVAKLPEYSEQLPVTEAEKTIFDAACSDYQFPLGTPSTVGKRQTDDSTDYKFIVKSRGFNGEESTSTIYVTVAKAADAKPEFTQVVR